MAEAAAPAPDTLETAAIRAVLKTQYGAALAMLGQTIERCPDALWLDASYPNAYWHVAYHAAFFVHLYLHPDRESYRFWEKHRPEYQFLGTVPTPPHRPPNIGEPYTRSEVLEYVKLCEGLLDAAIDRMDLRASESGFPWYRMSKLEHQLVSLRHVQHHTAQLVDRLRTRHGIGSEWVGTPQR